MFSSFLQTPLHWAASKGSVKSVNILIKHEADVSAKNVRRERVPHAEKEMCGDLCYLLTDVCLGVVAIYAGLGKIYLTHLSHFLSLFVLLYLLIKECYFFCVNVPE